MDMTHKRMQWIDMIKGIAIVAVVMLHCDFPFHNSTFLPLWSLLGNSWHVGVFFVMSGFFLKDERVLNTFSFVKGKFKTLYLPLIVAYTISIILHNFFLKIGFYDETIDYAGKFIVPFSIKEMPMKLVLSYIGAGREPIMCALWFVYCLFASYVAYALLSRMLRRMFKKDDSYEYVRCFSLFALCALFHAIQEHFDIHIPRYSNIFSIMWLVYLGYLIRQRFDMKFDSLKIAILSLIIFYLCNIVFGANVICTNTFHNTLSMTICVLSAFYTLAYVAKRMEKTHVSHALSFIGKNSFRIMTWHLLSFKLVTLMLKALGYNLSLATTASPYTESICILVLYVAAGVLGPCVKIERLKNIFSIIQH